MSNEPNKGINAADEDKREQDIEMLRLEAEEKHRAAERRINEAELELKTKEQRIGKLQIWIPIISVLLSIISAIAASVITSRTALQTKQLDSETQIRMDQNKYDYSREERKEKLISENLPKLLGSSDNEKKAAKAIIVFFYPTDAETILKSVAGMVGQTEKQELELNEKQVEAITEQRWGIVIGGDTTLSSAQYEVYTATNKHNYKMVKVYFRQSYFRTVIEGFSTKESADRANISVGTRIRDSSYVVNLNNWCPNPTSVVEGANAYFKCSK
jgi:hypothetical protein